MGKKYLLRGSGISEEFAERFRKSMFYTMYQKYKNELIIGVRGDYLNLYYNCDSIARIQANNKEMKASIANRYLGKAEGYVDISPDELFYNYNSIKEISDKRNKLEKQAQQRLFLDNNLNESSDWFCLDLEYKKAYKSIDDRDLGGRFDIIAINKEKPHRIALIELKYGFEAIGGSSGVRTHIKDYVAFNGNDKKGVSFFNQLKPELVSIIHKLKLLGVDVPLTLQDIKETDICDKPEFYIITLNNNPKDFSKSSNTPQKTMSGYLFNDNRWGCNRISKLVDKEGDYYSLIKNSKDISLSFLFSNAKLPNLNIFNILDEKYYDRGLV